MQISPVNIRAYSAQKTNLKSNNFQNHQSIPSFGSSNVMTSILWTGLAAAAVLGFAHLNGCDRTSETKTREIVSEMRSYTNNECLNLSTVSKRLSETQVPESLKLDPDVSEIKDAMSSCNEVKRRLALFDAKDPASVEFIEDAAYYSACPLCTDKFVLSTPNAFRQNLDAIKASVKPVRRINDRLNGKQTTSMLEHLLNRFRR